jgi:hypothetical protein
MSEITQNAIIKGKIVDSSGKPLPKVKVELILPTATTTSTTDQDGLYSFENPATNVIGVDIEINYSLEKHITKSLKKITKTDETKELVTYDIPRITLPLLPDPTFDLVAQVNKELNKQEISLTKKQFNLKIPPGVKFAALLYSKKNTITKTLIPFIIKLLLKFGTNVAQDVINKKIPKLEACPSSAQINEIIAKRNKLVKQLNNLYTSITLVGKFLNVTNIVITALQIGYTFFLLNPTPLAPGTPLGVIELSDEAKKKIEKALNIAQITVTILTLTAAIIGALLAMIINYLNQLDALLAQCAVDQNMDLEQLNNEINALANSTVVATQGDGTYKGFKLEVKINEKNTSKFIQRFAQAVNKQGVAVLKTEPSFASDPSVLIDQLKFIIDSNPNLTAE